MGVTYKLTDDIVQFIIDEKHRGPLLSCRELVDKVSTQFQRRVSKSSVNDILREARITSRRGRKNKVKFEIPAEKKAQLLASLPDVAKVLSAAPAPPPAVPAAAATAVLPARLLPLVPQAETQTLAQVFMRAAFTELFPRPGQGTKTEQEFKQLEIKDLEKEWAYRTLTAAHFKVQSSQGRVFYMDSRWQQMSFEAAQLPGLPLCPVERALTEAADCLLSNAQPVIVRQISSLELLSALADAMEGKKGALMEQVTVLDPAATVLAQFDRPLSQRREFIAGISMQASDMSILKTINPAEVQEVPVYTSEQPLRFLRNVLNVPGFNGRAFLVMAGDEPQQIILTNALPSRWDDAAVLRSYAQRHPAYAALANPLTRSRQTGSAEDRLRSYAGEVFFPADAADGLWLAASDLAGRSESNEQIQRIAFTMGEHPQKAGLMEAMDRFNALHVKDAQARPVWLKFD